MTRVVVRAPAVVVLGLLLVQLYITVQSGILMYSHVCCKDTKVEVMDAKCPMIIILKS